MPSGSRRADRSERTAVKQVTMSVSPIAVAASTVLACRVPIDPRNTSIFLGSPIELSCSSKAAAARMHLVSHRSCSQNLSDTCNEVFLSQLRAMLAAALRTELWRAHLFAALPQELMEQQRWRTHLQARRGRGYWFWKPALLDLLLRRGAIRDGEIIVYADADASDLVEYAAQMALDRTVAPWDVIVHSQSRCEFQYTKSDLFDAFGVGQCDAHYGLTEQPKADVILLRVNNRTRQVLRHWEHLASDFHLISDEPSRATAETPDFREHRHDQSILSMLLKASMALRPCERELTNRNWVFAPKGWRTPTRASVSSRHDDLTSCGRPRAANWSVHPTWGVRHLKLLVRTLHN